MEQKDLFEASAKRLPYVECSPDGRSGSKASVCIENDINSYPTWIIRDRKYKGVQTPKRLAIISGYSGLK
ncbi:MAG: hypothetical protein HOD92_22405 [Deltaproteobacteria bacterium]|nr:hypothetical protein [Deltaproteobacteria bacterium]MBT4527971.1 hypothetical protein [Deltaproteobacteria bacterium]